MYDRRTLELGLVALGELLDDREDPFTVVAIGGGALSLLGLIERSTEDVDLVGLLANEALVTSTPLPPSLATAIQDVAAVHGFHPKWINGEPTGLLDRGLLDGFIGRCERRVYGGLTILFASRVDQICLKLLAISRPNDKHYADLRRLTPSSDELRVAARWTRTQASGEGFELELRAILNTFGVESGND